MLKLPFDWYQEPITHHLLVHGSGQKVLQGRILFLDRVSSVTDCSGVFTALCQFQDQSLLLCSFTFAGQKHNLIPCLDRAI